MTDLVQCFVNGKQQLLIASIYMVMASRAHAFVKGRGFVTPEDIKQIAPDVLRHRIVVSYEAEAEEVTSADIVQSILDQVEVP